MSRELLIRISSAASELAQYASYAEIVGGISYNKSSIREWCDKVFDINKEVEDELEKPTHESNELREVAIALRDYIDAIPDYLADQFPEMPGVDRDWVDEVISKWGNK